MTYSNEAMGRVIAEMRRRNEISQDALGRAAGYSAGAGVSISRIENGVTRPTPDRLSGIAGALGTTVEALEEAARRQEKKSQGGKGENLRGWAQRLQAEVEERTAAMTAAGTAANEKIEAAQEQFYVPFIQTASQITGAPKSGSEPVPDEEGGGGDAGDLAATAEEYFIGGVASMLAGGATGAAGGAALGGASAYAAFATMMTYGTASTGAAISGLSGVAATNATLAALGGGALAAGGAGIAGGAAVLAGIVAGPAVLLALAGVTWAARRNRKQQEETRRKLEEAEAHLRSRRPAFNAVVKKLHQTAELMDYVAVHAGHRVSRWSDAMPNPPIAWADMSDRDRDTYQGLIAVAGAFLTLNTLNFPAMLVAEGGELQERLDVMSAMLIRAEETIRKHV